MDSETDCIVAQLNLEETIHLKSLYKQDLALNNHKGLICHQTKIT